MSKKFTRKIENFKCRNCEYRMMGTGYTNHCPKCLFSRHVDVSPGDRLEGCGGMMKPIGAVVYGTEYVIIHKCLVCGKTSKNKAAEGDNFETIVELVGRPVGD